MDSADLNGKSDPYATLSCGKHACRSTICTKTLVHAHMPHMHAHMPHMPAHMPHMPAHMPHMHAHCRACAHAAHACAQASMRAGAPYGRRRSIRSGMRTSSLKGRCRVSSAGRSGCGLSTATIRRGTHTAAPTHDRRLPLTSLLSPLLLLSSSPLSSSPLPSSPLLSPPLSPLSSLLSPLSFPLLSSPLAHPSSPLLSPPLLSSPLLSPPLSSFSPLLSSPLLLLSSSSPPSQAHSSSLRLAR